MKLKDFLEEVLKANPPINRLQYDPIKLPRWFFDNKRSDREVEAVALFSAMLAYGSAGQFTKKIKETLDLLSWNFYREISNKNFALKPPAYRFSTSNDIYLFLRTLGSVIKKNGSLKNIFLKGYKNAGLKEGLVALHSSFISELNSQDVTISTGLSYLLPNPSSGGCVKRWNMFLRWLVRRDDGVDMGIWNEVSPAELLIPLDRHISRISRNLGLTFRTTDNWVTAREITDKLKIYSPEDPIKYDFALCHLGIEKKCNHGKDKALCLACPLAPVCKMGA